MLKSQRQMEDEAIGWVIRLRDGDAETWEAFTIWLEADPAHLAAYESAALVDADAEALPPAAPAPAWQPAPAVPNPRHSASRRAFLGWGIAASLALFAGWYGIAESGSAYSVETGAGEHRTIALEDGTRIELNGGTRVMLDKDRPRFAELEHGEALFRVVHDEAHPFEVEAGGALLRDLGTVFNVVASDRMLDVAVSEGAVLFDPDGERKNLSPGMALIKAKGAPALVSKVDNDAVGAWRQGRLVYSGAPVSRIATDLSRNLGIAVTAAADAGSRPFSGVIMLDGADEEVLSRAAALLGLKADRSGDGWILKMSTGAGS